jgi:broad specificity phosphatase PhoE
MALVIDQAGGTQDIPPRGKIAMKVADRNDAMQRGSCGGYEHGEEHRQPCEARPKTPHVHPLFDTFSCGRVLSNYRLSCKHCRRPWGCVIYMLKIMIIRHAEKHQHGSHDRGVSEDGSPAHHELTVRGWQRAGALVHLFAPHGGLPDGGRIQTPRSIFASDATRDSPSLRAMHTVGPLAAALGLPVNHAYAEEEEAALAAVVVAAPSPALIVWHHGAIPRLVTEIAGKLPGCPVHWPDDRFDLIWILERNAPRAGWSFSQVTQRLLPGDGTDGAAP